MAKCINYEHNTTAILNVPVCQKSAQSRAVFTICSACWERGKYKLAETIKKRDFAASLLG